MRTLLNIRSRYTILVAASLFLALVLIIVGYRRWGTDTSPGLAGLSEAQQAWLSEKDGLRIAGRWEEPPFAFFGEDGTYQGYEVDLAHSMGPVLGIGIEVVPMPQEEAVIAMENGEIDAIMGMVRDAQSSDRYNFTEPYVSSSLSIFVRSERFDVTALEDLQGHQVAVQADSEADTVLAEQPGISLVAVQSVEEGLELVVDEQVSALVADDIVAFRAAQLMGSEQEIKVVGLPTAVVNFSFAVPKNDDALLGLLNRAMASVEAVGLKRQVDRAWLGTSPSVTEATATSPMITFALAIAVGGLVLGNVIYLLLKMRRRTEKYAGTLQESQDKYQKLVDGTGEAVFSVSGDGGLLEVNNQVVALTGYRQDELLRMYLDDLIVPAQRRPVRDCIEKASQEGIATLDDVSLVNSHGDAVPIQLSAHLVSQDGRRIVQCIARDVRERKRMRHQVLKRSEDLSTIGAIANMVSHLPDLEDVLNKVLAKVLDLTQMESGIIYLSEKRDGEMIPVVKQGLTEELVREMDWPHGPRKLADEVAQRGELFMSSASAQRAGPSGSRVEGAGLGSQVAVPLTSKDRVLGVISIFGREPRRFSEDDTALLTTIGNQVGVAIENAQLFHQLQQTVSDIAAVRQFSDSILQNMTNGLVVIDGDGEVKLVNRAGERMLGCREEEVVGSPVVEILGSGAEIVQDSLERASVYPAKEIWVQRGRGARVPLGMSVSPLQDDGGKLSGAVVVLSDLRDAKALEEQRRRLDRLALLGEMSAVMAHEIRNPLAGVMAGIEHLLTKFEEGDDRHEAMERILKEGERVNHIIEDILLISRPPQLNLAPCAMSEVIEGAISLLEERATEQRVEVKKRLDSDLPFVRGDRARLHQALSNLVLNAIEAMPDGGELSIAATGSTRGDIEGGGEGTPLWGEGGHVEVEIRDTGVGIKQEDLEKIWEPFWTTKVRGTGLGLPITRRIINEHGGQVEVESEPGVGTKFIMRLPLAGRGG